MLLLVCLMAAADPPAPRFLLPSVAQPQRYALDLTILPESDTFRGAVTIDLDLKQRLSFLWLNGKDLTVESATLRAGDRAYPARAVAAGGEFLGFGWHQPVGPGAAQLTVRYRGKLNEKTATGAFRRRSAGDWYVFTTFTAIEARRAFPCFDEPRYKTPWEMTLHVRRSSAALSNAGQSSESEEPGGMKRVVFAATAPLPSSLVAFAVGPFEIVDAGRAGRNGVPVRIVTPRRRAAEASAARDATPKILDALEQYTGIPYPFDKLDHLALLDSAFGAIENPGLIAYERKVLLAKPEDDTPERRHAMRETMAHELAHQWFGNLVTMSSWEDVWLSEGFATWMANKLMDEALPPGRNRILTIDAAPGAPQVRAPMSSRWQMRNVYSPMVYHKGAATLRMLENWLGAAEFQRGIRNYLAAHKFGSATTADFEAALQAVVGGTIGRDVRPVLDSLLDRSGAPVIAAETHCDSAPRLVLRQDRYTPLGAHPEQRLWTLPVCVKGDGLAARCLVLDSRETELPLASCPSWVFANAGAAGYYRTLLAPNLLEGIGRHFGELSAAERLSFAQDVRALVENGRLPAAQALHLLPAMAHDSEPAVVLEAGNLAAVLAPIVPTPLRAKFDAFVRSVLGEAPAPAKAGTSELLRRAQQKSVVEFLAGVTGS